MDRNRLRADTGRLESSILSKCGLASIQRNFERSTRVVLSFCARRLIQVQVVHHPKICLDELCLPSICGKPLRHLALSSRTMFIGPIEKIVGSRTVRLERNYQEAERVNRAGNKQLLRSLIASAGRPACCKINPDPDDLALKKAR
jgi:hypothetical protein